MNKTVRAVLLWLLAFVLTIAFAVFQRLTGPTYPVSGTVEIAGETIDYTLARSHAREVEGEFGMDAVVRIPAPDSTTRGTLYYHRLGVDEPFTAVPMKFRDGELYAPLPAQPPAGKLVYHIELTHGDKSASIPSEQETVTIRFKDPEPAGILYPHILSMFLALLFGTRTLLAVIFRERFNLTAWLTLIFLFAGGMILGPMLQKAAFGDYWTGWPFGGDVTDNKLALAFLAWLVAVWRVTAAGMTRARIWVVIACLLLFSIFLIPHSLGGSTFDYESGSVETGL
ncbi:MAG: hypothetical protein MAG453_00748 [Calditrichaeota bacterium]|nr:hypothetical protein [Calditrichota bacterium]